MNNLTDYTNEQHQRFPILAQLGILLFILVGVFGALLLPSNDTEEIASEPMETAIRPLPEARPLSTATIENVTLRAKAAYVLDVKGQRALFEKNANEVLPLASITKLMTTLVAYELITDDTVTSMPLSAIKQEGSSGLSVGERLSAEKLRKLALISSSNDAAFALGASVGSLLGDEDPNAQFVAAMNIRADELGLDTLEYWNPTGLDLSNTKPGAVGSAKDVSLLMEYIITHYPEIITPTQEAAARIYNTAGAYHEISNTNEVALEIPNMIGSKTGFTDLAGGNLTIAFDAGFDRPIIITVLRSTRDERFSDVLALVKATQDVLGNIE
ncbi:D-alanyl-D-alanine carboxypeptidase [Candidatus Kaiserbacteria bacterium]|nr:D-alanyl-D-alanine carboxypeptidase [Candidatus Kaiserbacteria bacterium]USN88756.1 MAG: D-alanyl-D-alanine carboxypeptidase [Candidatus Nomurabacteria bacterium]